MSAKDDFVYIPSPSARQIMDARKRCARRAKIRQAAMWCLSWALVILLPAGCVALAAS